MKQKVQETRVEGDWYLFEKEGESSGIQRVEKEDIEHVYRHWVELKGWAVMPVVIYRKS